MKTAYVDTSCLLAVALAEPGAGRVAQGLERFDQRFSSNLLEAELRSALMREEQTREPVELFSRITWVFPSRPLTREFRAVLSYGYVKGADLWHIACALFLSPDPHEITFLTLDRRQKQIAAGLGFPT